MPRFRRRLSGAHRSTAQRRRVGLAIAGAAVLGTTMTALDVVPAHAALACGSPEVGQNVFLAVGEGNYATASNWSAGHTPVADDHNVCIPGGTVAVYGPTELPTHELIGSHDGVVVTMRIEGTLRVQGGVTVSTAGVYGGHNLLNGGVIQVLGNSTLNFAPDQNGAPAFQNVGNVVGGGQIQVQGGSTLNLQRPLLNNSTIDVTGGGVVALRNASETVVGYSGTGTVIGGPIQVYTGLIDPSNGGPLDIRMNASGGIRGTIGAAQSVTGQCTTFSGAISLFGQVVNNGTFRLVPASNPSDNCGIELAFRQAIGGTSLVNNGRFEVGDASRVKGFGYFGTSPYFLGTFVNGPSGTVVLNDVYVDGGNTTNDGTWTTTPGAGTLLHAGEKFVNNGTVVNGNGCQVRQLENNGVFDLVKSCQTLQKATLGAASTLRLHASSGGITRLAGGDRQSTLGGTLDVVTDPADPPAIGTVSDVLETGVTGTFSAVTATGGYAYRAIYAPGQRPQVELVSFTPPPGGGGAAVTALNPGRLVDTRPGATTVDGQGSGAGLLGAGQTIEVQVAGRSGVPADATAAILNVTVTEAQAPGFVTVWPCGSERPTASSLNFVAGSTVANGVISKIGAGGAVCIFVSNPTQVLADVSGFFGAGSPYVPLVPARVLDSRSTGQTADGRGQGGGPAGLGTVTEVQVTGRAGVPADAVAAALNVTVTEAQAPGYATVFPCGTEPPNASSLNFVAGGTVPNNVIGKVGEGGKVCVFTSQATHLIVDVAGFFRVSASFQPLTPGRVLDTRATGITVDGQARGLGLQALGAVVELPIAGRAGVAQGAAAAVLNVTVTEADGAGYVTVWPCGTERPTASSVNFVAGATVPNGVIAKIGAGGKVCLYVSNGAHLIVDVAGSFTS